MSKIKKVVAPTLFGFFGVSLLLYLCFWLFDFPWDVKAPFSNFDIHGIEPYRGPSVSFKFVFSESGEFEAFEFPWDVQATFSTFGS